MNTKNATLIAVLGTTMSVVFSVIYAVAPQFLVAHHTILSFIYIVPPVCVLIFFVTLYSKQSNQ